MALCPSGAMSLGGSDAPRSVACELGLNGTTQICMDQAAVRTLAGRAGAGTAICMCDFYGKSNVPPLGCSFCGGYYFGAVSSPANYYIIIAPNAEGCACCPWKTTNTSSVNTGSCTDGYANTRNGLASAEHPAGNWTATRSIGGFSDWYLPARNELNLIYSNRNSAPSGQGFVGHDYWSSTESCDSFFLFGVACRQYFLNGVINFSLKANTPLRVRAVRRQAF